VDKIARDVDRDYIMDPHGAVEYGLIDRVISSSKEVPVPTR
jgi:ATP-dependent Clp protease protease subunit